ncbi:MAG: 3-deoxy-manno-octulosonate cytidylyltransferase [Saprospiraceae bacterium]|nr:3-deoxy-manno-octulosonate cytidylyltransferase [Saprospiraceae bacterium]MDC3209962.1 3-deoxy-manno-octulosonate cytidylyltransferase [Saprospiraceae bacterium]MDG1435315.1 3-deoxy-manno-octulosonate cytidylyltransferase [Saprospiraceae bacterium]MDG2419115.1 3-deoxy-manno-octulosonate cytidylyltransferase [Saprospiraceae bacterium]
MKSLGIIPARFESSRFPGKPLVKIGGKTMIQRVYEQCQKASSLADVIVATDDIRIFDHVNSFGGKVKMTASHHPTGTDRIAEVALSMEDFDLIVNIQGDEPFIHPQQIDTVIDIFEKNKKAEIVTGVKVIDNQADIFNPNVVKCVFGKNGKALLFSRSPIPYLRNEKKENWSISNFYKHIGMYAFRRSTLLKITKLAISRLEELESLEQLRWLENGIEIYTTELPFDSFGIDTPEDLQKAEDFLKKSD